MSERRSFEIEVDSDKCQGCANCVVACPVNAERSPEAGTGFGPRVEEVLLKVVKGQLTVVDESLCDGCGVCVQVCPTEAIRIIPARPSPARRRIAVGEAAPMELGKFAELEKTITKYEVQVSPTEVKQVEEKVSSAMQGLRATRVRLLMELGKVQEAKKELAKAVRSKPTPAS